MKLLRTFPILANAVVLLSIVGVSVATRSIGLLLVGGVLAALSWYVTEGPRGRSLPNWTANILIIAASLNVVVELIQATDDILLKFDLVDDLNRQLRIKMAISADVKENTPLSDSTVRRELQYLQSHTIHHFALISMILRLQGLRPADDFGVAPSTLQYLQKQNA